MKLKLLIFALSLLTSKALFASGHDTTEDAGEPDLPHTSKEWRIWAYSSAAPSFLAQNATLMDVAGDTLRGGHNGWTCMAGNPRGISDPEKGWKNAHEAMPVCADEASMAWMQAWMKGEKPQLERDGFMWMLHGDMGEDNTTPMVMKKSDAADSSQWIESGPHLMLMPKDTAALANFTEDFTRGEPFVMFPGSHYAHLMIPVEGFYRYQPESSPTHSQER